jgi:hypothetical protein
MSVVEKLRVLLAEKFERRPWEKVELLPPLPPEKWVIAVRISFDIFITAYENGKILVDAGPEPTRSEIREYLSRKKYGRMYEKAKTEEEKERILRKEHEEIGRILEDFKQRRFEKYLKMTSAFRFPGLRVRWSLADCAKSHMWGIEVAKRVSEKHGIEVRFEIDAQSGFFTTFDSTGMDDEQLINETMKRVNAIAEAREVFLSEKMMNEFLKSKGIEVSGAN